MKRRTKVWLIVAAVLFLIGTIMIVGDLIMVKFDFSKLSTVKFETNTYEISEEFSDISIQTGTSDIIFLPTDEEIVKVVCSEDEKMKHTVAVQDGVLVIELHNAKEWYDYIGISFGDKEKIKIYLPNKEYEKFSIKASTGDVKIQNLTLKTLDISVTTGDIKLEEIVCDSMSTKGSTGDLRMKDVLANKTMTIQRTTGNVKFEKCDAPEINIKVSTGDVKGSLLTEKIFIAKTSTGKIKVPKSVTGGKCEITTSTGNIKINYY